MPTNRVQPSAFALFLIAIILLETNQSLPTVEFNTTTNLRSNSVMERILEVAVFTEVCRTSTGYCVIRGSADIPDSLYSLTLESRTTVDIMFELADTNQEKELTADFKLGEYARVSTSVGIFLNDYHKDLKVHSKTYTSRGEEATRIESSSASSTKVHLIAINNLETQAYVDIKISYNAPSSKWALIGGIVGGAAFLIIILGFGFYMIRRRNKRRSPARSYMEQQHNANNIQSIKSCEPRFSIFPDKKFKELKNSFSQNSCIVCLDDLSEDQLCRQLACEHIFHSQCIREWMVKQWEKQRTACCPYCHQEIKKSNQKDEMRI